MAPKAKPAADMKKFEDAKRREFIVSLWQLGKSYGEIGAKVNEVFGVQPAKSTIQYVIKRFKNRPDMYNKGGPGRKTRMTAQYAFFLKYFTKF